jgi:ubiquinone biosynthesis protein
VIPAARLQRVAFVLTRHGFGEVVARLGIGLGIIGDGSAPGERKRLGERLTRVLADLGPTYIKLGQLLATREDVLPPEITTALKSLHGEVPPMSPDKAVRAAREALGNKTFTTTFAEFDRVPIAAASIGQVHRARLKSGEEVVVKVQRTGLREQVTADLQILRWLAGALQRAMPEVAAIDPLPLVDAFEQSILGELDFRREAANAARLGNLLAGAPEVRVPRIIPRLTRETLLVMERIHGCRLDKLDEEAQKEARAKLLRAFTRQILDHGVFHADPHPGNVLVEADGRVVLLDLGAVDALDAPLRAGLGRLIRAIALGRKRALCDAVLALSPDGAAVSIDRAALERELASLVAEMGAQASGAKVIGDMVAIGRKHRLRMDPKLVALVRALALLDGVLRGLDPARDLVADLRREAVAALFRRVRRGVDRVGRLLGRIWSWWTLKPREVRALPSRPPSLAGL